MLRLLQFNNRVALSPCNRPASAALFTISSMQKMRQHSILLRRLDRTMEMQKVGFILFVVFLLQTSYVVFYGL